MILLRANAAVSGLCKPRASGDDPSPHRIAISSSR